MLFLYPSFLWALLALSIPIIVHLFNFRKSKLVLFPNVRFLDTIRKKSSSTLQLKHLLILIARLLFIAFLVLTFAQPYFPGKEKGLNGSFVNIFIDNSQSMSNHTAQNQNGLTAALKVAEDVLNLYPKETKFRLLTNDFDPASNNYRSKENTLNQLLELDFSSASRSGLDIFNHSSKGADNTNQDIFIISDFQKSTYTELSAIDDSINQYHIIPILFNEYDNIYVDSVYLNTPFVIAGQRNQITVKFGNKSNQNFNDVIVKLRINERQTAGASINLEANSSAEITFELDKKLSAINRGAISFEDFPIVFDNEFYFTFGTVSNINIVEVTETSISSPIKNVYAENDLFDFNSYPKGSISYDKLRNCDLLIVNELVNIDNGLSAQINALLSSGKSVVVIPSNNITAGNLTSTLGFPFTKNENANQIDLDMPDIDHPFFKYIYEEVDEKNNQPHSQILWTWSSSENILLKSKIGMSFLSQIPSKGNLFIFATPFNNEYTDFQKNALFVPVMHRIAEKSSKVNHQLSYDLNQSIIQIQLDSLVQDELYKMKKGDSEILPTQKVNGNQLILDIPKYLMSPGFYDLLISDQTMHSLAFNHNKSESDLPVISAEELVAALSKVINKQFYSATDVDNFSTIMKEKYHSIELWKYALILCLVFLVAEILLIRFL